MTIDIKQIAEQAGISMDCWDMGAASLAYSDGVHGVTCEHLERFAALLLSAISAERDRYASESAQHFVRAREWAERAGTMEAERDQERAARQEAQRQLYAERERLYKLVSDEQVKASRLHAELEALRRGEFICARCALRQPAEYVGAAPF